MANSRRTFLKQSLVALAGVLAVPLSGLPAVPKSRGLPIPTFLRQGERWVINPEWRDAPYELGFITHPQITDPWAFRFRTVEDGQQFLENISKRNKS